MTKNKPPLTPLSPGQTLAPDVSPHAQESIGRTIVVWAKLEAAMQDAIWHFLGLDISDGRSLTDRMDVGSKVRLLRAFAEKYLANEIVLRDALVRALLTIEERQADRNFIAHGTWGTLMPDGVPMALSLRPKSAPGEVVAESFTDKRMNEIIDDISVGIHALMAVTNHLIASRHRPAPPPHLVT